MSGGGCSLRRQAALDLLFDERLELGPRGSYAMGEDVDLTHRASSRGTLLRVGSALISHPAELTEVSGSQEASWYRGRALMRRYLATKEEHHFWPSAVAWSQFCEAAWLFLLAVRGRIPPSCVAAHIRGSWESLRMFRE